MQKSAWEQHVENHSYLHGEDALLCLQQNVPKVHTYSFVCLQAPGMPYPSEQAEMVAQECSCDQ